MTTLIAAIIQIFPTAYIVVTGTVPTWIRIWLGCWLGLWALVTTWKADKNS